MTETINDENKNGVANTNKNDAKQMTKKKNEYDEKHEETTDEKEKRKQTTNINVQIPTHKRTREHTDDKRQPNLEKKRDIEKTDAHKQQPHEQITCKRIQHAKGHN